MGGFFFLRNKNVDNLLEKWENFVEKRIAAYKKRLLERMTRLELATSTLARWRSTR